MTNDLIERSRRHHEFADLGLVALAGALLVSLVIAATAVSIGIARADTLAPLAEGSGGRFALVVFLGVVIAGVGGLTAAMVRNGTYPPRRD